MRHLDDFDLHAFVDEQVGASRRMAIKSLLDDSPVDAARVDLWRRQNDAIRAQFAEVAAEPVPLWLTVGQIAPERARPAPPSRNAAHRMRAHRVAKPEVQRKTGHTLLPIVGAAFLAFATGCVAAAAISDFPALRGAFVNAPVQPTAQPIARHAREAHDSFSAMPDPAEMKGTGLGPWLERRLGKPVAVPDLRAAGWALLGGRITPTDHGPAALLLYDNGLGDRLSLVEAQDTADETSAVATLDAEGVLSWHRGATSFAIVTSRPGDWLAHNGGTLVAAVDESKPARN